MSTPFGHCSLCPKNSPSVKLYGAGVCSYHLQHPGDDHSKQKVIKEVAKELDTITLKQFFASQVKILPAKCENCKNRIVFTAAGRAAHVCHILPKKHFKSVQTDPVNVWYGCIDCHTNYDQKGWAFAETMPIWPVILERFKAIMHKILPGEVKKLPPVLREVYDEGYSNAHL
jgi:hypothetical protein